MPGPLRREGADILLDVRLTPRGGRDGLDGLRRLSDGRVVLSARVRAIPEDRRANAALATLVADAAGVPKSSVSLAAGATARVKTLRIRGLDAAGEARLAAAIGIQ